VYALERINFQTFSGDSRDYRGDVGTPKFEVMPEHVFAPMVEEVSIYTASKWRWMKREEETGYLYSPTFREPTLQHQLKFFGRRSRQVFLS
jgi:hypothetical protein